MNPYDLSSSPRTPNRYERMTGKCRAVGCTLEAQHSGDHSPIGSKQAPRGPSGAAASERSAGGERGDAMIGPGGAPTRATTLPTEAGERKKYPVATGVLDYFPDSIVALARLSWQGNEQHNPGQSLRWAREKSGDEADTLIRHFLQRGTVDTDGVGHSVKLAWRALALLQKEIEKGR